MKPKIIFWWHYNIRGHAVAWFACGKWVTSVECYTCNKRWETK